MESKKQVGSSSSFTAEIFGAKDSSPSSASTGVFASIFPPPQMVAGRKSSSDFIGSQQKQPFGNQAWYSKHGDSAMRSDIGSCNTSSKDGSIFREERGEPCHLSSSLYYGGQDIYSHPGSQATGSYLTSKKDGVEGDQNGNNSLDASRGNWWQGSLYY